MALPEETSGTELRTFPCCKQNWVRNPFSPEFQEDKTNVSTGDNLGKGGDTTLNFCGQGNASREEACLGLTALQGGSSHGGADKSESRDDE